MNCWKFILLSVADIFEFPDRLHPMSGIGAAFALMQRDRQSIVEQQIQKEEDEAV